MDFRKLQITCCPCFFQFALCWLGHLKAVQVWMSHDLRVLVRFSPEIFTVSHHSFSPSCAAFQQPFKWDRAYYLIFVLFGFPHTKIHIALWIWFEPGPLNNSFCKSMKYWWVVLGVITSPWIWGKNQSHLKRFFCSINCNMEPCPRIPYWSSSTLPQHLIIHEISKSDCRLVASVLPWEMGQPFLFPALRNSNWWIIHIFNNSSFCECYLSSTAN